MARCGLGQMRHVLSWSRKRLDDEFIEKVHKYFAATVMEARRLLEPGDVDVGASGSESEE